jgi:hypothetical protein
LFLGGTMELSFSDVSSAEASQLVQELELSLLNAGAPAQAISFKRRSAENMDLGTILGINVDLALQALGATGYLACFANCIFELAAKHRVAIIIDTTSGTIKIPASEINVKTIEKAIAAKEKAVDDKEKEPRV